MVLHLDHSRSAVSEVLMPARLVPIPMPHLATEITLHPYSGAHFQIQEVILSMSTPSDWFIRYFFLLTSI